MTTNNIQNRLITPELEEALKGYPLYSQDGKKKDATCIVVFSLGNVRWYIMEGQREGDDFTLYGIVAGLQETEYGYASANEMASIAYDPVTSLRLRTKSCRSSYPVSMTKTDV